MKTEEALALYEKETESYHRLRLAFQRGDGTVKIKIPLPFPIEELEDYPAQPKVAWVLRPPGFVGEDTFEIVTWGPKEVRVGGPTNRAVFRCGSGRSWAGRNTLRHGRIDWEETIRRHEAWRKGLLSFLATWHGAIGDIQNKWSSWVWGQNEDLREYQQRGEIVYALTRYPKVLSVVCAYDRSHLHRQIVELFRDADTLKRHYSFFQSV